jgi:hypothetical protein
MLNFHFSPNRQPSKEDLCAINYPEVLSLEGFFQIAIDNYVYFEEPCFSIMEFLVCVESWLTKGLRNSDMNYDCIDVETEENPLIRFVRIKEGYIIRSSWELFHCSAVFDIVEIQNAIKKLRSELMALNSS